MRLLIAATAAALCSGSPSAHAVQPLEPVLLQAEVSAPPAAVWQALATQQGVTSFFASEAMIDPRVGGAYELYFLRDNPKGLRGTEGVRILAMEAPSRLLIGWNAPPTFGPLRDQQTIVEFALEPTRGDGTLLTLTHSGWGRGAAWRQVRNYFEKAWPVVLGRLQYRFDQGPVDWNRAPNGAAYFEPAAGSRDVRQSE